MIPSSSLGSLFTLISLKDIKQLTHKRYYNVLCLLVILFHHHLLYLLYHLVILQHQEYHQFQVDHVLLEPP